jgi:hypothetical protein
VRKGDISNVRNELINKYIRNREGMERNESISDERDKCTEEEGKIREKERGFETDKKEDES